MKKIALITAIMLSACIDSLHVDTTTSTFTAPIKTTHALPEVMLKSNNGETYSFLLDTGAITSVMSPRTARLQNVSFDENNYISRGTRESYQLRLSTPTTFTLQGTQYTRTQPFLVPKDSEIDTQLQDAFELFDGVVGLDFFCNMDLIIDGPQQILTLSNAETDSLCDLSASASTKRPSLSVNAENIKFRVLIDTGDQVTDGIGLNSSENNDALWRSNPDAKNFRVMPRLSSRPVKFLGLLSKLSDNNAHLVFMSVDPDEDSSPFDSYNDTKDAEHIDGFIGWKILQDSVISIPFENPENSSLKFAGDYMQPINRTGIVQINFVQDDLIKVIQIFHNSPAAEAGILEGDMITHFNNIPVSRFNAKWLYDLAYNQGHSTMTVTYQRNGLTRTVTLKLRDYIYE